MPSHNADSWKENLKTAYLGLRGFALAPFYAKPVVPNLSSIRSILVFRFDRIGDMVNTTPMLAALRREFPRASITVLASEANEAVVFGNPNVDRVAVLSQDGGADPGWLFKSQVFDLLIDPYWEYEFEWAWVARRMSARYRLGFDRHGRGVFYNIRVEGPIESASAAEQMLELCRRGLRRDFPSSDPRIYLQPGELKRGLRMLAQAGVNAKPLILLHPGGHYAEQRWPVERFVQAAQELSKEGSWEVALSGGPREQALLDYAVSCGVRALPILTLRRWICVAANADIVVCNNSGPLHAALALDIPVLSLLGPATDRSLWVPQRKNHVCIDKNPLRSLATRTVVREAVALLRRTSPPASVFRSHGRQAPAEIETAGIRVSGAGIVVGMDVRELQSGVYTGIGRFIRNFLQFAAESLPESRFVLYGNRSARIPIDSPNFTRRILHKPWPLADHWELPRALKQDDVDIYFSPYYKAPILCPCPFVITIYDLIYLHAYSRTLPQKLKNRLLVAVTNYLAQRASGILTSSEYSKEDMRRELEVDMGKIEVIAHAVASAFHPLVAASQAEIRERFSLPERFVLYVGNFMPHKNVGGLLDAYGGLAQAIRDRYGLVLVGAKDIYYQHLLTEYGRWLESENVRVISQVPDETLAAIYSSAVLCVMPSLYEGFGLPVLEAMACGTPVLASNRTSLAALVGEAGVLVDPSPESMRSEMLRILENPSLREELREKGLIRARQYHYRNIGARRYSFLEKVFERAGGRSPGPSGPA